MTAYADFFQLLTGAGPAAIAVLRITGPSAAEFAARRLKCTSALRPGAIQRAVLMDESDLPRDDVLVAVVSDAPVLDLRLSLHGNPWLVRETAALLERSGFHERADAPLWPARDPISSAAYALLPRLPTLGGVEWLLRQMEQLRVELLAIAACPSAAEARARLAQLIEPPEIEAWFTRPLRVALVGRPNVGKSTLINALADQPISLVSDQPGTTRDWVEFAGEAEGCPIVWLDTAGLRPSDDPLEQAGVERTLKIAADSDACVLVLDAADPRGSSGPLKVGPDTTPLTIAINKCDLAPASAVSVAVDAGGAEVVPISALRSAGLERLKRAVLLACGRDKSQMSFTKAFTANIRDALRSAIECDSPQAALSQWLSGF